MKLVGIAMWVLVGACSGPKASPSVTEPSTTGAPAETVPARTCPPLLTGSDLNAYPAVLHELRADTSRGVWITLEVTPAGRMLRWSADVDLTANDVSASILKATGVQPMNYGDAKNQKMRAELGGDHVLTAEYVGTSGGTIDYTCTTPGGALTVREARDYLVTLFPTGVPAVASELLDGQPVERIVARVSWPDGGEVSLSVRGSTAWRAGLEKKLAAAADGLPVSFTIGDHTGLSFSNGSEQPSWKIDIHDEGAGITSFEIDWSDT